MKAFNKKIWFVTGSQHLYGPKVLEEVDANSNNIVAGLNRKEQISAEIVYMGTAKGAGEILDIVQKANNDPECAGIITWMHTFSPAKMWIAGLSQLNKPFAHLHTQFNAGLPWDSINMNFMNTNQSAHGCREFGFIGAAMELDRKVIVGHWQDGEVHKELDDWIRAAMGWAEAQTLRVARFGDNMRNVAVTDGNKVSAQIQFGFEVHGYGVGELVKFIDKVEDKDVDVLLDVYHTQYDVVIGDLASEEETNELLRKEARLELGMKAFLEDKGCMAYTNCFEDLTGMSGLPGLATQRLMEQGYGYGGEGDWKTAAFTRIMKVMATGLAGGTSFMEDYTYNFADVDQVLGAHMLEVCPTIANKKPTIEIHRHTIGCNVLVPRMLFTGKEGYGINISVIDLGPRFRMIMNEVEAVRPEKEMPHLPVASTLWEPLPSLKVAAGAWIHAGGAHHTTFSQAVTPEMMYDFATIAGIEIVNINENTQIQSFKQELSHNALYYRLNK
ncbi:L-arabinose isomerase [Photobacterium rosenbergii]|uniref:L-arabinose isomerase n=1 Tax=Photobacterium rosenbergii TaxID=294936 RepID=A0A2T3N9T5_9GAMM|nr:L-arabinose isomerase [Photobacterium rosenbergii]PSW10299.1 L-arabinose isomerase [Photobacterium rosenbergii]